MSNDCEHKNPLVRGGTSRNERYPKALDPAYAKVDERSRLDLLQFVQEYAAELGFYRLDNQPDGTWEIFFSDNVAGRLAEMASFDVRKAITEFVTVANAIASGPPYKKPLKSQFDLLFTLLYKTEMWNRNSLPELLVYRELQKEISSTLSLELLRLVSYYKKAAAINLINTGDFTQNTAFSLLPSENVLQDKGFSPDWFRFRDEVSGETFTDWSSYMAAIAASEIYDPKGNIAKKARYSQSFLEQSMERITSSFSRLAGKSGEFLEDILENHAGHEPHMGLLLAFLNLFSHAQAAINSLTGRHLDFYYKEVLQLSPQAAVPDRAHVLFEPARNTDKHIIKSGTGLVGGKDAEGTEILFKTLDEQSINKASIASLRNIYFDRNNKHHLFASPVADSSDGLGADFGESPGKWLPFGSAATSPAASSGFLICADILLLQEDARSISVDLVFSAGSIQKHNDLNLVELRLLLSGEEGWIERKHAITQVEKESDAGTSPGIFLFKNTLRLNISLSASDPAMAPLDSKLHDTRFSQKEPAIFVECLNTDGKPSAYQFMKDAVIRTVNISVSAKCRAGLLLQNNHALIDPSKPFMPFGPAPKVGSSFIIGCPTVFHQAIDKLTLTGKWNDLPEAGLEDHYEKLDSSINYESFTASRSYRRNGNWHKHSADSSNGKKLFQSNTSDSFEMVFHDSGEWDVGPEEETEKFDIKSKGGFIRLELDNNSGFAFGHKSYPKKLTEQAMKESAAVIDTCPEDYSGSLPNEPYTPLLSDFAISFESSASILTDKAKKEQYENNHGRIFQVHPFGVHELHPYLKMENLYFLPQFSHEQEESNGQDHQGELIIGLKDLEVPGAINLLFKVAEGSEDPELEQEKVYWLYLSNDEWVPFESNEILADNTRNLTSTGILSLSVPAEAGQNNSILPSREIYIMGAIEKNTPAACKIIDIHAQAVLSEFSDEGNEPGRTAEALPAGSISKLKAKDAKIKAVSQPYESFDGKAPESDDAFYLRVAERLRHKSRGISVWDYERLILQEFPDIYKVKCINHTAYGHYSSLGSTLDAEFAPGYVTLIVIPSTHNMNAINPFEPRVSKSRILDIEAFIKSRISPFAAENLKILNPLYEKIRLEFEVDFHLQYADRGLYEKQLNEDIKQYLSPWAYSEGKEITLGNRLHRSTLIDFVEERYYVDYIRAFKMHRELDDGTEHKNLEVALPTTARSAFVSVNDPDFKNEHIIKKISV